MNLSFTKNPQEAKKLLVLAFYVLLSVVSIVWFGLLIFNLGKLYTAPRESTVSQKAYGADFEKIRPLIERAEGYQF